MLNRATKLMNKQMEERAAQAEKCYAVIRDAQEALRILGFEEVSLDKVIDTKPIIINKGKIVEVQVIKEVEVTKEVVREIVIDNTDNNAVEEQNTIEGGDAMASEPKQPKRNPLLDKIKKAKEFTLEEAAAQATKENEERIAKEEEEKEATKAQFPKYTLEYEQITFDESIDSRTKFGVRGIITFDEASYPFEATNNHHMPIVYGCYDEDVIRLTKEIIMLEIDKFNFMNEREHNAANYAHINDAEFPLVVWRVSDDKGNISYHGYSCTKQYNYILTWDKNKMNHVGRKLVKNAHSNKPNLWKKLSNEKLADKFRAVCASIWPEDFTNDDNDPEPTKDKNVTRVTKEQHQITKESHQTTNEIHQQTNEQHQSTKEFFHITKEQQQNTNDEEIRVTKEQDQPTNEIIWDTPIDNIGVTKDNSTNDDTVDLTADADDLDF